MFLNIFIFSTAKSLNFFIFCTANFSNFFIFCTANIFLNIFIFFTANISRNFKMLLAQIAGCHSKRMAKDIDQKKFQLSSSKTEFFTAVWSFDFFQTIFYFLHAFIRITAHAHTRISRGVEKKLIFSLILMKNPDLKSLCHKDFKFSRGFWVCFFQETKVF